MRKNTSDIKRKITPFKMSQPPLKNSIANSLNLIIWKMVVQRARAFWTRNHLLWQSCCHCYVLLSLYHSISLVLRHNGCFLVPWHLTAEAAQLSVSQTAQYIGGTNPLLFPFISLGGTTEAECLGYMALSTDTHTHTQSRKCNDVIRSYF